MSGFFCTVALISTTKASLPPIKDSVRKIVLGAQATTVSSIST
jgi:hypothetical protein